MSKPHIVSALAASLLASSLPASAQAAALRIGDLDLTSEAGKAELARRVELAVRQACPGEEVTGTRMGNKGAQQACEAEARGQIEAHVARRMKKSSAT
jgi:UrcA family protein